MQIIFSLNSLQHHILFAVICLVFSAVQSTPVMRALTQKPDINGAVGEHSLF